MGIQASWPSNHWGNGTSDLYMGTYLVGEHCYKTARELQPWFLSVVFHKWPCLSLPPFVMSQVVFFGFVKCFEIVQNRGIVPILHWRNNFTKTTLNIRSTLVLSFVVLLWPRTLIVLFRCRRLFWRVPFSASHHLRAGSEGKMGFRKSWYHCYLWNNIIKTTLYLLHTCFAI